MELNLERDSISHQAMCAIVRDTISTLSEAYYACEWYHECEYQIWYEIEHDKDGFTNMYYREALLILSGIIEGWVTYEDNEPDAFYLPNEEWADRYIKWKIKNAL